MLVAFLCFQNIIKSNKSYKETESERQTHPKKDIAERKTHKKCSMSSISSARKQKKTRKNHSEHFSPMAQVKPERTAQVDLQERAKTLVTQTTWLLRHVQRTAGSEVTAQLLFFLPKDEFNFFCKCSGDVCSVSGIHCSGRRHEPHCSGEAINAITTEWMERQRPCDLFSFFNVKYVILILISMYTYTYIYIYIYTHIYTGLFWFVPFDAIVSCWLKF
jgi:hypothetical protein